MTVDNPKYALHDEVWCIHKGNIKKGIIIEITTRFSHFVETTYVLHNIGIVSECHIYKNKQCLLNKLKKDFDNDK